MEGGTRSSYGGPRQTTRCARGFGLGRKSRGRKRVIPSARADGPDQAWLHGHQSAHPNGGLLGDSSAIRAAVRSGSDSVLHGARRTVTVTNRAAASAKCPGHLHHICAPAGTRSYLQRPTVYAAREWFLTCGVRGSWSGLRLPGQLCLWDWLAFSSSLPRLPLPSLGVRPGRNSLSPRSNPAGTGTPRTRKAVAVETESFPPERCSWIARL